MPGMARAIRIDRTGGPEVLAFHAVHALEPGSGQVLVRQTAIGVNFIDTYHRSGRYPLPSLPSGLGMEAAGVVEKAGPEVTDLSPGARVAYATGPPGAYADLRLVQAAQLIALPEDVDDETAAAVLLKGMTVEALTFRAARPGSGDWVLFHAGAGGVGLIACQWLAARGVKVIATVGNDEKAELVRARGAAEAIVYTREDFVERVRQITSGEGVRVAYDAVGKDTLLGSLECVGRRGTLVCFGSASGKPPMIDPHELGRRGSLTLTRPVLFDYVREREELLAAAGAVFEALRGGRVTARIERRFSLEDVADAHRALEARATTGQMVLIP